MSADFIIGNKIFELERNSLWQTPVRLFKPSICYVQPIIKHSILFDAISQPVFCRRLNFILHRYESDIYFHFGLHCMWFVSTASMDVHDIITGNKSFGTKPVSISCHRFICLCFLPLWIIWFYFANIWGKLRQNGKSHFIGWNPAIVDGARWNRTSFHPKRIFHIE